MPVVDPLAQKALSNGTQVHCSGGAVIGMPRGMPPPEPELDAVAPPLPVVCPVVPELPPDPVVPLLWLSVPPEQAARAMDVKSEPRVRIRSFIARVQRRSGAPSSAGVPPGRVSC